MSVDTRTPRTPTGGSPGGFFDDEPVLSSVKVPSDPAQVIVSNASFRVKLATPSPAGRAFADTAPMPAAGTGAVKRRTPLVYAGRSGPGDTGAGRLLQALSAGAAGPPGSAVAEPSAGVAGVTTQVLPRAAPVRTGPPTVVAPREAEPGRSRPSGVRPTGSTYDGPVPYGGTSAADAGQDTVRIDRLERQDPRPRPPEAVRQAYYPGRRMNLGVVLLPLRIFLGFISIYAGMGKLTDPVYFDGGERGSMVNWLTSLEPWGIASPLHAFAVSHPVGAGLTVAFLQVLVGVLTVFGLWQRLAASFGALLSAALLLTVSWRMVAAYDTPDIIYLAAWSPLIIAGAPVYSLDSRLAGEAWRTLGPRAGLWDLRRRVLRRGAVMVTLIAGLALLIGSMMGSAVRSAEIATVPEPGEPPRNHLPGSPLPTPPGERTGRASQGPTAGPTAGQSSAPPTSAPSSAPPQDNSGADVGSSATGGPSQDQTVQAPPQEPAAPPPPQPEAPAAPTTGGSGGAPAATGGPDGNSADDGGSNSDDDGGSSGDRGALGGLLG